MSRETKSFKTPAGHEVVHYTYATGREAREMEAIILNSVRVDVKMDGTPSVKEFDSTSTQRSEEAMLKNLVVSIDGKTDNVLDTILDLPEDECEFIIKQVNEVIKKKT
jgi:hypothetical protein